MKTLILILALVCNALAQSNDTAPVINALSGLLFHRNCTRGELCVIPDHVCPDLRSFFDRSTCCPTCRPNVSLVLGAVKQFLIDYPTPCTETAFIALPTCAVPTTLATLDPNTFLPSLADGSTATPKGCPTCRPISATAYLERKALRAANPALPPCTYAEFQACVFTRPRCKAGQVPRPTPDSCCPFPCIPTETVCKFEDVFACVQKQSECLEGETPVSDENSCCPSCRPPRPVCTPECDDNSTCVWTRQQPTDQTATPVKRQVVDPTASDPTTTVPRAICRPRRVIRLVLKNIASFLAADSDNLRVFVAAAVRRFCLQGKMGICAAGILDAIENIRVDDVKQANVGGSVETSITLTIPGIPDATTSTVQSTLSLATTALPSLATTSAPLDGFLTFIVRAVQNIHDEITTVTGSSPFDIARFLVPIQCRNVSKTGNNCGIVPPPACNETERVKIDPVTCCPSCRRDHVPPPPKVCPKVVTAPCIADLTLNTVEAPRLSTVDGCFHCKPRDDRPSTTTRCTFDKLVSSVANSPVCPEFQLDPDSVSFVRNDAAARGISAALRCAPHCVHPLARCTLADRILCVRNQPDCASGQLPEIADGSCCATCAPARPTCNPPCDASNNEICIRDRATNGTTGKCVVGHPHTFQVALGAAVKAVVGDLQSVKDVKEVIHHLIHSFEHTDNAASIDALRHELTGARDYVNSFDPVTGKASVTLVANAGKKRSVQTSTNTLGDSCSQSNTAGSTQTCSFTAVTQGTTTGSAGSGTTGSGSQSTTGNGAVQTTGASSLSVAVALMICFVASFIAIM